MSTLSTRLTGGMALAAVFIFTTTPGFAAGARRQGSGQAAKAPAQVEKPAAHDAIASALAIVASLGAKEKAAAAQPARRPASSPAAKATGTSPAPGTSGPRRASASSQKLAAASAEETVTTSVEHTPATAPSPATVVTASAAAAPPVVAPAPPVEKSPVPVEKSTVPNASPVPGTAAAPAPVATSATAAKPAAAPASPVPAPAGVGAPTPSAAAPKSGKETGLASSAPAPTPAARPAAPARAAAKPPDDTPSIKIGLTMFADYTYQRTPKTTDADRNAVHPSSFNVSRSYINLTANLSHVVSFRVTPDIARESGSGSSLAGSLTFRTKYAYAQFNLDDWLPKGSFVRLGIQQTPFIDSIESIYRYRFQGTVFPEREGYMSSADAGVSFRTTFPQNYGDVHVGLYNGESYSKSEVNDQKALMVRVGFRPLAKHAVLKGWRVQGYYTGDNYVAHAERKRAIFDTTFEHKYLNAGFDYIATRDQSSSTKPLLRGEGWSVWATPKRQHAKNGSSVEALVRFDRMRPDTTASGISKRTIAGVSYWFPKQGAVSSAILFDVEQVVFTGFGPARPKQQKFLVQGLFSY